MKLFAVGQEAVDVVAIGQAATGVLAIGQVAGPPGLPPKYRSRPSPACPSADRRLKH